MQQRINQILQERINMGEGYGGCGNGMEDYSRLMGEGRVYRKRKSRAPAASEWINHVKNYADHYGLSYREALSEAGPSYHKMMGSGGVGTSKGALKGWATRKKNLRAAKKKAPAKKKASSKVSKKKAPVKRKTPVKRKAPVKRQARLTEARKFELSGLTRAQWNKLSSYEKTRIAKFYQSRSKEHKKCRIPNPKGMFFLKRPGKCILKSAANKRKLLKKKT